MAETAVPSLYSALVLRLESSPFLVGDKVYEVGKVPAGSRRPYVTLANFGEGTLGASRFMQRGHNNTTKLNCWGDTQLLAMKCFAEAKRLLDGYRLTLQGHTAQRAYLDYLTDFAEPEEEIGGHVVVASLRLGTRVAP